MAVVVVIGFEVVDIHQQNKVFTVFHRWQVLQAALKAAPIIEAGKRIHHTEIGKGLPFFQQPGKQFLRKAIVASLQNVMNSDGHHRKCERIGHSQPHLWIA